MQKKPRLAEAQSASSTPHRSQYQVTIDRLCRMSPAELKKLGQSIAENDAGEFVMKMLNAGFAVKQGHLPGVE